MARTPGRVRSHTDERFNLNNIKKGAEKRAHDDFFSSLKEKTGISLESGVARDVAGIGNNINSMTKELVNSNIQQISRAALNAASNGERSNTLQNFMGVSKLGIVMLSNAGVNIQNKENMAKAIDLENSVFNKTNLEQLNQTLIRNNVIYPEDKLIINKNDMYKSLTKMQSKLDIYTSEKFRYDVSRESTKGLVNRLQTAKKNGNQQDLVNILETQIGINELIKRNSPKIQRQSRLSGNIKLLVNMNVNNETLRGYNSINNYRAMSKTLVRGTHIYYKSLAKGLVKVTDFGIRGTAVGLNYIGLQPAANTILSARSKAINASSSVNHAMKTAKISIRNTKRRTTGKIKHGVVVTGRATGKVVVKGAQKVGDKVTNTHVYSKVAGAAQNVGSKVVNSRVGKTTKKVHTVGKKVTKKVAPKAKTVGRVLSKPFKMVGQATKSLLKGLNVFSLLIKKVAIVVGAAIGGLAIASTAFVLIVGSLTVVGDAVSKSLNDFKTNTTMGATYAKLLEKEQQFNEAVMNLTNTVPVPTGYESYKITQYTNVNVHYLGADGKELSWSGAVGDVNVDPSEVTDTVWTYMKKKGWTDFAIAGLLGNMQQESSFNTTCLESSADDGSATALNSGYGLCQWTNTQGNTHGRRYGLFQYAASHGGAPSDIKMQLDYLLYGEGSDSALAREYGKKDFSSVAEATAYFCNKWERPNAALAHLSDVRIPAAQKFYNYYSSNAEFSSIVADDIEEDTSGDEAIIASGYSTSNTTTIKGILSMAAVYIDQDFKKYGAYTDGVFADSVYKDYCAKLYDSSHIIGIDQTPPVVYYCPAYSATEAEPAYHAATDTCNNKIPGSSSESAWLSAGTGIDRSCSLSMKKEEDSYETTNSEGDTETHYYDKYTVLEYGPHGAFNYTYDHDDDDRATVAKNARESLLATGCENYSWRVTGKGEGYTSYVYVCHCDECRGHVDANAYVFVSNIYDPTYNTAPTTTVDDGLTEGTESETEEGSTGELTSDGKAFDYVDKKDQEYKYSLYALDKYATAFDNPDSGTRFVYCTNTECSHYQPYATTNGGYDDYSVPMIEITIDDPTCPECGTELNYPVVGRPGDQESCDEADETGNRAAEQHVMEDITGLPMKIVDWWNNESWFTNLSTTKTYFRLPDFEESIDILNSEPDENGDKNIVNKNNSSPYWFNAFTSVSGRNSDFEKHGWDNDSITRVRLLMANDWTEMYGIKDFGYVQGAPMTAAQIAQIIANNPDWKDLPLWRQQVMAVCASLSPGHPYVWSGKASSPGLPVKGLDCSGFTQWAYWTATGVKLGGSTGQQSQEDVTSGKLVRISASELLPGDIGFKFIGGSSSQSNSNHVGIYAGMENGVPVWCHESGSTSGYKFKAAYSNFTVFFRISPDLVNDNEFSNNANDTE